MKKIKSIFIFFVGFLLLNVAVNAQGESAVINQDEPNRMAGEFVGDYYYYLDWYNQTFPGWEYHNEYEYWEMLWLNNGTEDTWVMVVVDYNLTIIDSGELSYLYFEIYNDPDGSFLGNYDDVDDWNGFEDVDWEEYDEYYLEENEDAWNLNNTDPGDENLTDPWDDSWEDLGDVEEEYDWGTDFDWEDWDEEVWSNDIYTDDYDTMQDSLDGDEGFWFIDIFFEEWSTTYSGYINYTWYNIEYGADFEIIVGDQLDPALLGPAEISPYEDDLYHDWEWEWAQMMLVNETYNDETYSWIWFSYNIGQWVSLYDETTEQFTFISQDIAYMGMSLYEDMNGNGVVDSFYEDKSEDGEVWIQSESLSVSQDYELNKTESESKYSLNIDSVGDVVWGEPKITENTAEFWICLEDIEFLAIPYASNYNWFMEDSSQENLVIPCNVEFLNISFFYESDDSGSSIAIKHDIAEFTDPTTEGMLDAFGILSMTIDYSVYSDKYSEILAYDEAGTTDPYLSENLNEAVPVEGEVSVAVDNDEFMNMDFSMNYTWGKDGNEYENTVAINPLYGYCIMYSDAELGQASTIGYKSASYMYSMCFNWDGYAITMDPTFVSYYKDYDGSNMPIVGIGLIILISLSASAAVVMVTRNKRKAI
jgi:hypothetical protein